MIAVLVLVAVAIALRIGLHAIDIPVEPFQFWPVHLLSLVLIAYLSGYRQLKLDRQSGFGPLMRDGMRDTVVYAVLIALFSWAFYTYLDTTAFADRNALLVEGLVNDGFSEEQASQKVQGFFTPSNYAGFTFLGLMIVGAVNTLLFALIHHKLLRKFMR